MDYNESLRGARTIRQRCSWVPHDPLYRDYHDREWGVPLHDDRRLFEFLVLEGMQAGLSWSTVLQKRGNFRRAFDRFEPARIAGYGADRIRVLLSNPGIIRNRLKIEAAVGNARAFLEVRRQFGSFDAYLWTFVGGEPRINAWKSVSEIPPQTQQSRVLSKDLVRRGFRFVGPTICYAFMQAVGMVNDHTMDCFRYQELGGGAAAPPVR